MRGERLLIIDFSKAFAIILVVLFHFFDVYGQNVVQMVVNCFSFIPKSKELVEAVMRMLGPLGVSLFLIASGLGLEWNSGEKPRAREKYRIWYLKRASRLYPAYWCVWACQVFVTAIMLRQVYPVVFYPLSFVGLHPIFDKLFFAMNGSWWFLFLILQFYVLFPILHFLLRRLGPIRFFLLALLVTQASRHIGQTDWVNSFYSHFNSGMATSRMTEFCFGMIFAGIAKNITIQNRNVLFFACFMFLSFISALFNYFVPTSISIAQSSTVIFLFTALYSVASVFCRFPVAGKVVFYVSAISYEIFLINWPVIDIVHDLMKPDSLLVALMAVSMISVLFGWGVAKVSKKIREIVFFPILSNNSLIKAS